jgi:hypothetical protein
MKQQPKGRNPQLSLLLPEDPVAEIPCDKQRELARALVELLIQAVKDRGAVKPGDPNESKTHS